MKLSLKKIAPFLYRTAWNVQPGHEVEKAFTSNGVEYFCFSNGMNAYFERYQAAMDAINQLELRVDRRYLELHVELTKDYIRAGKLDMVAVLNRNLEERMNHISNVDMLYALASVWYFSKEENVYTYNHEYAEKKIAAWRKDKEVLAFFFKSPLRRYMPLEDTFIENTLPTFTKGQRLQLKAALNYHLSNLREGKENAGLRSKILSQIQALDEMLAE